MKKKYYFFYLEIAIRDENDSNIYAFENLSHIPTTKLCEIFEIDLEKDPFILEGYFLTKASYKKHRKYIAENVGQINPDLFEYCLRLYVAEGFDRVRKLYKEDVME